MLHVEHLKKSYGDVEAIGDLTFDVAAGEFVCIVGPSGCGKTTLLKCVAGLLEPTAGEIRLGGAPVDGPPDTMALVFQEYSRSLFPWMSVRQNVAFPLPAQARQAGAGAPGRGGPALRRARRRGRPLPVAALRRHAAARGDRPRARLPAADPADGRAVRVRRRADARRSRGPRAARSGSDYDVTIVFVTHDIDESVYLSDRVIVLTPSPTRVRETLEVALPRPRDQVATEGAAGVRAAARARVADDQAPGRGGGGVGELILPPAYATRPRRSRRSTTRTTGRRHCGTPRSR